jgi:hypothetical protein
MDQAAASAPSPTTEAQRLLDHLCMLFRQLIESQQAATAAYR